MSAGIWHAVEAISTNEAREAVEYGLMERGALGTETRESVGSVSVTGYFAQPIDPESVRAELLDSLRIYNLTSAALIELKYREVADRDWLTEWKKHWQPVEVGRFVVAPPWITSVPPGLSEIRRVRVAGGSADDRILIRINPGMAFGTGTHETTRLCLKAIEKYFRGGSFLDAGTGTGILAIAAAMMFRDARIEACDVDVEAIAIAKENAAMNGVGDQIIFRVGTVDEQTASADLVCANLTAPLIVELLPALIGATCGRLILCGILDSQLSLIESRLLELGAQTFEMDQDGEWLSLIV